MYVGIRQLLFRGVSTSAVVRYGIVAVLAAILALSIIYEMDPLGWRTGVDAPAVVVVQQGDTLWTLARAYGRPTADPRQTVSRIREANHLAGSLIRPGEVLLVPQS